MSNPLGPSQPPLPNQLSIPGAPATSKKSPPDEVVPAKQPRLGQRTVKVDNASENKENVETQIPSTHSKSRSQLSLNLSEMTVKPVAAKSYLKQTANTQPLPVPADQLEPTNNLGRGTFGAVQLLESKGDTDKTRLAFKTTTGNDDAKQQLLREAQIMADIPPHDNVVKSYGIQTIDGQEGLVLEFVNGKELGSVLEQLRAQSARGEISHSEYQAATAELWHQVLTGVAHLHDQGIIHGDLKPNNIMLDRDSLKVKVMDFGGSARIGDSIRPGHELYTAPEGHQHMAGKRVDAKTSIDNYATGQMISSETNRKPDPKKHFYALGLRNTDNMDRVALQYNLYLKYLDFQKTGIIPNPIEAVSEHTQLTAEDYQDAVIAMKKQGIYDPSLVYLAENAWKYKSATAGHRRMGFTSQVDDFSQKMLHFEPEKRMGVKEALQHPYIADRISDARVDKILAQALKAK